MAATSQFAARLIRNYSHQGFQQKSSHYRLKGYAVTGYLCAAFTLPFVPPYLATQRTKQDGTYATRAPLKFEYHPTF